MRWIFVILFPLFSYFAGASAGAFMEKGYVSLEDLKMVVAYLIEDIRDLRRRLEKVEKTKGKVMIVKENGTRVRLYPWGKVLGTLPKGTEVVVFGKQGEFYITNLGFIHESLLEERR